MESTLGCNRYDTKPSNKKNQPAEAESQSTIARATETPDGTRPIYAGDRQLFDFIDEEAVCLYSSDCCTLLICPNRERRLSFPNCSTHQSHPLQLLRVVVFLRRK